MAGSIIRGIKSTKCGWDSLELDKHSHKGLMKCLYKSNMELWKSMQISKKLEEEVKALQEQLAHYIIKEQAEKENTGIMDVKEPIDLVDNIHVSHVNKATIDEEVDKELAKNLLEAESVVETGKNS